MLTDVDVLVPFFPTDELLSEGLVLGVSDVHVGSIVNLASPTTAGKMSLSLYSLFGPMASLPQSTICIGLGACSLLHFA